MKRGDLIGRGNTADIYILDDEKILKQFTSDLTGHDLELELTIHEQVESLNLSVPKAFGKEKFQGKEGIVYEWIKGEPLTQYLMREPHRAREFGVMLATLHQQIFEKTSPLVEKQTDRWIRAINHVDKLTKDHKAFLTNYIEDKLPHGQSLCHGDFHPDNILISDKGPVIIDWMTASTGHPMGDVTRTLMILEDAVLPDHFPNEMKEQFGVIRKELALAYLEKILNLLGEEPMESIEKWQLPLMAARLMESIPQAESDKLLIKIQERVNLGL